MIKLNRPPEPQILYLNKSQWTVRLIDKVNQYNGYENIPDDEKKSVLAPYRSDEIKEILFSSSYKKCAFCECIPEEGGGYMQVEHFHPKSIYHDECFEWLNFLPCCNICNVNKGTLDTKVDFLINPYDDEPKDSFHCNFLKILPNRGNVKAFNTEKEIELNSSRLINSRTELLRKLQVLTEELRDCIDFFSEANTPRKVVRRRNILQEKFEEITDYMRPEHMHSFFCSEVITQDEYYLQAKGILGEI
ncbi:HNH endonuclease [Citrobacter braakii]